MRSFPEGIPTLTAVGPKAATRDQRWKPSEWSPRTQGQPIATAGISTAATRFEPDPSWTPTLFADGELAGLRARWDDLQAGFVDDPRDCVQRADGLVSDVVEHLVAGFADARSRLEERWARGDEATTEDLRIAAKRYREFFDRLLAM